MAWWRLLLPRARARQRRRRAYFVVARLRYRVGTRCSSAALRARATPRRAPTGWCRPMQRSRRHAVGARCRQVASPAVGRHKQREREREKERERAREREEANAIIRGNPRSIKRPSEGHRWPAPARISPSRARTSPALAHQRLWTRRRTRRPCTGRRRERWLSEQLRESC